ncbi:hypothetical protein PM082_004545 [Marasmius tenuissimus]|nr:hypothetical protein PM082_004545 [Marasmius tenuissimus]
MPSSDTTTSKNPANDEVCGVATIQAHLPSPLSHLTPQTAPTATAPSVATVDPSLMTAVPDTTVTSAKILGRASVSSTFDDEVLQLIWESETPPTTPGPATQSKGKAKGTAPLTPSSSNAQLADKLLDSGKKQAKPKAETLIKDLEACIVELASNNRTHFLELHECIDRVEGTPTPLADPQFRERLDELERTQSALKSSNNQLVTHVDGLTRRSIEFGNQLEQISGQLAGVSLTQEKLLWLLDSMPADAEERPRKRPNTGTHAYSILIPSNTTLTNVSLGETSLTGNSTTTSTATTGTAVATLATPTPALTIIGTPTNASIALNPKPADVNTASSMPQPATQGYVTSAATATSNPLPPAPPPAPAAGPAGYYETSPWYTSTIPAAPAPALPPPPAPAPTYPGNNGQYTVRVGPIGLGGSSDYNGVALLLVWLTRRGHRLSHQVWACREGPDTLILSWRTATEARDFYEAWHEGIPQGYESVSVSLGQGF